MITEKHLALITRLMEKTRNQTAAWQETSQGGVFSLSLASFSVLVSQERGGRNDDEIDTVLKILDSNGRVIEILRDVDTVPENYSPTEWYREMSELYAGARRTALGVDKALDALIKELDDDIPF